MLEHLPPPGDVIGDQLRAGTYVVPPAHELVLELLTPGDVLLDCGAHIGTLTIPAARAGARVVSVEANPTNADVLARNGEGLDVRVVRAAVGATSGTVDFLFDGAWGRIVKRGGTKVQSVTGRELDCTPDVVKLDVEGSEIEAFTGLAPILGHHPPIVFECNAYALALRNRSAGELRRAVEALGYRLFQIETERRLVETDSDVFQARSFVDLLAVVDLPDALRDWSILPRPTPEDVSYDVAAMSKDALVSTRRWLAAELATAPAELRVNARVVESIERLRSDEDRGVRKLAKKLR